MPTKKELLARYGDFVTSQSRNWGVIGERYYSVENDILTRNGEDLSTKKSDERLSHATYRNLVDEKVSFLLAKEPVITIGAMGEKEKEQVNIIRECLGESFQNKLITMGVEASNKIVGWLQPYIDGNGQLKWHAHDSLYVKPIWVDKQERELEYVITIFDVEEFDEQSGEFNLKRHLSVNYPDYQEQYQYDEGELIFLGKNGYFTIEGEPYTWGRVPFIPFFNNSDEICDIKLVKSLIDAYDIGRSESQNFIEDIRNFILVLKGYNGDNIEALVDSIRKWGAIAVDSGDGAGVDGLNAQMNITDTLEHFVLLKKDIYENAQGVNRDIGSLGSNPTNLSLKFLFAGLNLKADKLEAQFKQSFQDIVEFIKIYCDIKNIPLNLEDKVRVSFNRDMTMNESELIRDINASVDLSLITRLEMHPFVDDVDDEIKRLSVEDVTRPVDIDENTE